MTRSPSPVTQVVAIGIGAALFFVLGRFVAIPTPVPNTAISIQYAILAVFAVLYGPLGRCSRRLHRAPAHRRHRLRDLDLLGAVLRRVRPDRRALLLRNAVADGEFTGRTATRFALAVLLANAVAWLVVAPLGDVVIYSEPANKVWTQGALAFVSNSLTAVVLGIIILSVYSRTRTRTGSLSREQ